MTKLFPFQEFGSDWLAARTRALLADEMGLGKSAQAISAADKIRAKKIIVICPAMLRGNWKREFLQWQTIDRKVYAVDVVGSQRNKNVKTNADQRKAAIAEADVVIISYDQAYSPTVKAEILRKGPFDVLIVDEAHYLKNRQAKRTMAILGRESLGNTDACYAFYCKRLWMLTGTPMPNDPSELFTLARALGLYEKRYTHWLMDFCAGYQGEWGFVVTGTKNAPKLKALFADSMLRRRKEQVLKDMPPISWNTTVVEMNDDIPQLGLGTFRWADIEEGYKRRWQEYFDPETGDIGKLPSDSGMATIRRYVGMHKVRAVVDMAAEMLDANLNRKLVLFAYHRDVVAYLHAYLADNMEARTKGYGAVRLWGGTPQAERDGIVATFQGDYRCRVIVCQITAANTGLTLTAAHDVWIVEPSWVPAENAQAAMRCHRIGQKMPVDVRFIALSNSVDEQIMDVVRRKAEMAAAIFD